ncbi:hypothetical protein D3C71_2216800 [compost metagenome]
MEEVVALENSVLFHHPQVFGADERFENRRGNVRVVVTAEGVTNIMQERAHDVLLITTIAPGASSGL